MSNDAPEPGLVRVENTSRRPNAVVLDRRTVALTVFALLGMIGAALGFVLDARAKAEAARMQSATNANIVEEVQRQSELNGQLIENLGTCLLIELGEHRQASNNFQMAVDELLTDRPGFEFERDPFQSFDATNGESPDAPCERFITAASHPAPLPP